MSDESHPSHVPDWVPQTLTPGALFGNRPIGSFLRLGHLREKVTFQKCKMGFRVKIQNGFRDFVYRTVGFRACFNTRNPTSLCLERASGKKKEEEVTPRK